MSTPTPTLMPLVHGTILNGGHWFHAGEACAALGLPGPAANHLAKIDTDNRQECPLPYLGEGAMAVVSEAGLFRLASLSDAPAARPIREWWQRRHAALVADNYSARSMVEDEPFPPAWPFTFVYAGEVVLD